MSAIRVAPHEYRDPMTHQPFTPEPPRAHEVYPVTTRKATPDELARLGGPATGSAIHIPQRPPKPSASIGMVPSHRHMEHVSDAAVRDQMAAGTVMDAARHFRVGYATMHRRVAAMRRAGVL